MLGFLPTRAYRPGTPGATTFLSPLSGTFNYGWDSFDPREITLFGLEDGTRRVLNEQPRSSGGMRFSPDSRHIAVDVASPEENAAERDISVISVEGGQEIPLVQHPADDFVLGWSPDGGHLLFASDRSGSLDAWVIPVTDAAGPGLAQPVLANLGTQIVPLGLDEEDSFYYGVVESGSTLYVSSLNPRTGEIGTEELLVGWVSQQTGP